MDERTQARLFPPGRLANAGYRVGDVHPKDGPGARGEGDRRDAQGSGQVAAQVIRITVRGSPAPQGSKSFKGLANSGRAILAESSKKVRPWRQDVKLAAEAWRERNGMPAPFDGPLIGRMVFTLPKPKSAPKTRRTYPDRTPDLSKLLRSTEDALKEAGLIADDARIIGYDRMWKTYPNEDPEALDSPGVVIMLRRVE